jgi:hypothetical protein
MTGGLSVDSRQCRPTGRQILLPRLAIGPKRAVLHEGNVMKKKDLSKRPRRGVGVFREHVHDPYKTRLKLHEPTVCPGCGAVYHEGRWTWAERPAGAHEELCQACHRIRDEYPAGYITIRGAFALAHKDEIVHLARHEEGQEKAEHPLHRIIGIAESDGAIEITTTDIHLPRRLGHALERAFKGKLEFFYEEEAYLIRVHWTREA